MDNIVWNIGIGNHVQSVNYVVNHTVSMRTVKARHLNISREVSSSERREARFQ